jgi:hypothetical protein
MRWDIWEGGGGAAQSAVIAGIADIACHRRDWKPETIRNAAPHGIRRLLEIDFGEEKKQN